VVLRNILIANQIDNEMMKDIDAMQKQEGLAQLLKYSLIVVASVPMLVLYPFIQKHFVKGIMIGALKG
jgi:ABC-type glycerol-3-phosphate transport system permease component